MIKKFPMLLFLIFIIGLVAYLESPYSFLNRDYYYSVSEPVLAQPIEQIQKTDLPVIEEKLENIEEVDGYIIETYREYEIYKDKNGVVIKSVPTTKMNVLKYWDY